MIPRPADLLEKLNGRAVVVSVSGGKDSSAVSLLLREWGIPHRRIFMDTGWEHRSHYEHLQTLENHLGPIDHLRQPVEILEGFEAVVEELESLLGVVSPMVRLCVWKGFFPGQGTRWCTSSLKVVPAARWLLNRPGEVVNVVGIRRAESIRRREALEWEPMTRVEVNPAVRLSGETRWIELDHVEQWRPIVDWTLEDVLAIHQRHGVPLHPLYRLGADRVGCWPCIFAADKDGLRLLGDLDPERVQIVRLLEDLVEKRWRHRIESKGRTPEKNPPTWFQARDPVAWAHYLKRHPELEGLGAKHQCIPIDRAMEWARTSRGGRQALLFAPPHRDWACTRFGFCEIGPDTGEPGEGEA